MTTSVSSINPRTCFVKLNSNGDIAFNILVKSIDIVNYLHDTHFYFLSFLFSDIIILFCCNKN